MRRTLQDLRERPKQERTAIAGSIAIGIVALLFLGWLVYFFHSITTTPAPSIQNAANSIDTSGIRQANQQFQQAYGSSTQFIESASGTIELEQVSSTSEPSL